MIGSWEESLCTFLVAYSSEWGNLWGGTAYLARYLGIGLKVFVELLTYDKFCYRSCRTLMMRHLLYLRIIEILAEIVDVVVESRCK